MWGDCSIVVEGGCPILGEGGARPRKNRDLGGRRCQQTYIFSQKRCSPGFSSLGNRYRYRYRPGAVIPVPVPVAEAEAEAGEP